MRLRKELAIIFSSFLDIEVLDSHPLELSDSLNRKKRSNSEVTP